MAEKKIKKKEKQKEPNILNVNSELIQLNVLHRVSGRKENYWCFNSFYFIKSYSIFSPKLLKHRQTEMKI